MGNNSMEKMRKLMKKPLWLLSILVVFVTVYSLVLPAITLDEETANNAPDIVLDSNTEETTVQNDEPAEKQSEEIPTEIVETATVDETETVNAETEEPFETINNVETQEPQETEPVKVEVESEYPAVKFSQVVNDSIIYVEAPEGAFMKGTSLEAEEVEDTSGLEESINNDLKNSVVKKIKAIDIRFIYNEEEVEPLVPIKVSITSAFVENNDEDALLMHIDDEGKTNEVIQSEVKEEELETLSEEIKDVVEEHEEISEVSSENTIIFESDSFSVYAIVYVQTIQIETDGGTYNITVSYTEDAQIPEGSVLNVREIEPGTIEYDLYLTKSATQLNTTNENISFARFFDIEILKDDEKIEPTVPVNVDIRFNKSIDIGDDQEFNVVHFIDEETIETINYVNICVDNTQVSYVQDSFSVTGTIVTSPTFYNNQYALIMELPDPSDSTRNKYYTILNDGSLDETTSFSPETGTIETVVMDRAMLWTCSLNDGNQMIYHNTDASLYDSWTNLAIPSCIVREYINPSITSGNSSGLSRDDPTVHYRDGDQKKDENNNLVFDNEGNPVYEQIPYIVRSNISIQYANNKITKSVTNGSNSISYFISATSDRSRITGVEVTNDNSLTNAPKIYMASVSEPNGVHFYQNTVNHIDIGINGKAVLNYPIPKGTYYDSNGNAIHFNQTTKVSIKEDVPVTVEDIKSADLTAYQYNSSGEVVNLSNAFYITGYSSNASTEFSYPQVRIEGAFKVSTDSSYNPSTNFHMDDIGPLEEDYFYNHAGGREDSESTYHYSTFKQLLSNRMSKRVYYTVSTTKNVTFYVTEDGTSTGRQLYYDSAHTDPVKITVPVTLSSSFDYWDSKNECPAIKSRRYVGSDEELEKRIDAWKHGCITWGDNSGMDFILGNVQDSKSVALEITKFIVNDKGEHIKLASGFVQDYDLYQGPGSLENTVIGLNVGQYTTPYSSYNSFNYKKTIDLSVGSDGIGIAYDYKLDDGLVYVEEYHDEKSIPSSLTDYNGYIWDYYQTHTETEYVKRGETQLENHFSANVNKSDLNTNPNAYKTIPEVIGNYIHEGVSSFNDYLDFYIYNVYKPRTYSIQLKKVDKTDSTIVLEGAHFTLYGPYATEIDENHNRKENVLYSEIVSDSNGIASIGNLESGVYYLYETSAPAGYNLLSDPFTIIVDSSKEASNENIVVKIKNASVTVSKENNIYLFNADNTPGAELPMTGGSGIEYICSIGGLMMLVSGIIIIRRRYMA